MFGTRELARLNLRKVELVAQSDATRRELVENWARVQPVVSWVESGTGLIRQIKPVCLIAAPLLGIWAGRKGSSRSGLWSKVRMGWRLWQAVAAAWRSLPSDKA